MFLLRNANNICWSCHIWCRRTTVWQGRELTWLLTIVCGLTLMNIAIILKPTWPGLLREAISHLQLASESKPWECWPRVLKLAWYLHCMFLSWPGNYIGNLPILVREKPWRSQESHTSRPPAQSTGCRHDGSDRRTNACQINHAISAGANDYKNMGFSF